jgi:hypothetical protein
MNAHYLHLPDGTPTKWSQCGVCHSLGCPGNFDLSEKCCTCYDCGLPLPKDERVPYADGKGHRSLYHRECEGKRRNEREQKQLEEAELIPEYNGPVYCDGRSGSFGDGYFADVDELAEDFEGEDDTPEFAFCCTEHPFPAINVSGLLESSCDDMDDDAYERLEGIEELESACEAFREKNSGVTSWYVDYKRKVRIPHAVREDTA